LQCAIDLRRGAKRPHEIGRHCRTIYRGFTAELPLKKPTQVFLCRHQCSSIAASVDDHVVTMKKQTESAKVVQTVIRREIDRDEASRYDHRLHALLLVAAGRSCAEVAQWFGENSSTVQRWVRRFRVQGLDGLHDVERPGRPCSLDAVQRRRLEADLRKAPRYFGFAARAWDGPTLAEHLRRCYGVDLGLRQCQRLYRQMGFRPRRVRGAASPASS
jgi:transposase